MDTIEWMPYQAKAIDEAATAPEYAISAARQNGKTEAALEVARRAASHGESVLYVTDNRPLASDAAHRLIARLRFETPELLTRTLPPYGDTFVELRSGGSIHFSSYRSRPIHADRIICDDYQGQSIHSLFGFGTKHVLYVGLQLPMPIEIPHIRFGADYSDDLNDETVWRKANPGMDITMSIERFKRAKRALNPQAFAAEMLNRAPAPSVRQKAAGARAAAL